MVSRHASVYIGQALFYKTVNIVLKTSLIFLFTQSSHNFQLTLPVNMLSTVS